ncbi:MAG: hypothetical protein LAT55_11015 [Opitutales bacterium]|nr:hypothetical protein [Opitutales bacterium]
MVFTLAMIWLLALFFPLLMAALIPLIRPRHATIGAMLVAAALPTLVISLIGQQEEGLAFPYLFLGTVIALDGTRAVLLFFTSLLWLLAGWFAGSYQAKDPFRVRFDVFFLLSMTGNFGLILAADIVSFYGFFVLMTFASFGLVVHTWTAEAIRAGHVYLVLAVIGEVLLLASIFLAVAEAGSILVEDLGPAVAEAPHRNTIIALALAGFGVKAGVVPLYFWLPLAHPVAPTPASAVLSGAMIKAGLVGWVHIVPLGIVDLPVWGHLVVVLGLLATFGAVVGGLGQTNPKTILAYSSISQIGLMTIVVGLGLGSAFAWQVGLPVLLFLALNHSLAKGALFLGTGVFVHAGRFRGWVIAGLAVAALAIAGFPLTGGAQAKYGILEVVAHAQGFWGVWLPWLLSLSSLATTLLLLRFLRVLYRDNPPHSPGTFRGEVVPWGILVGAVAGVPTLAIWLFGLPLPEMTISLKTLWGGFWPIGLAVLIYVLAHARKFWRSWEGRIPPGDFIVFFERIAHRILSYRPDRLIGKWESDVLNIARLADRIMAFEDAKKGVDKVERAMGSWSVVGFLFLATVLWFIFFVAF